MPNTTYCNASLTGVNKIPMSSPFHTALVSSIWRGVSRASGGRIEKRPRKPKRGCEYVPSTLRPFVCASDRIMAWHTPFSSSFHSSLRAELSVPAISCLFEVLLLSLDENTRSVYGAGLLRFHQFCDTMTVPEHKRMPASEILLAAFAATAAAKVSRSCLDSWLAGIHFWHIFNGAPWHGANSELLTKIKTGVSKTVPDSSRRVKRPPVTIEHMHVLREGLDLTNSFDSAVWACATIAFWGCCRLGELVIPTPGTFNSIKNVTRDTVTTFGRVRSGPEHATFHIPWTKTTKEEGADITITSIPEPTNPLSAFRHHLKANASVPGGTPLFAYETADGGWAPLSRSWFLDRVNGIWQGRNMLDMYGHGFRIGGATELLLRGVPPDIVAAQGRWKSRAFLDYWRKIESILPTFVSQSFFVSRFALLTSSMASFRKKYGLS